RLGPSRLVPAEPLAREGLDPRVHGVERDRRLAPKGGARDRRDTRVLRQAERLELPYGLGREPAAARLRADSFVSLENDHFPAGFGEDLRGAQAGRPGADDDVLDRFHAAPGAKAPRGGPAPRTSRFPVTT